MIPAALNYHIPADLPSAIRLLQEYGYEARVIAGGISLVPMKRQRLVEAKHLVDLRDIDALKGVEIGGQVANIGAMTTQHELIAHEGLANALPILREAALQIADPHVRYVGTIGGNIANGDPGNDMPGLMLCLDARYHLTGPGGKRTGAARDFYKAAYFTMRENDEILTGATIPLPAEGTGYAFSKQKRNVGGYASAAAAVLIGEGEASVAMTNLSDVPVWSEAAGNALAGGDAEGSVAAMLEAIDPQEDTRGPTGFKKYVASIVLRRAIDSAMSRFSAPGQIHEQEAGQIEGQRAYRRMAGPAAQAVDLLAMRSAMDHQNERQL